MANTGSTICPPAGSCSGPRTRSARGSSVARGSKSARPPSRPGIRSSRRDPADRFPRAALTGLKPSADEVEIAVSRSDRTGTVIGVLLTEQGMPPADATAWLLQGWNSEYEPVDPASGEFAFERVPDGTY